MTKVLLVLTVVAMFALTFLVAYESYQSLRTPTGETQDDGTEESPFPEINLTSYSN